MTENEFIDSIDAHFFFNTVEEYENATRIGCSISDNAALMVGYELASLSSHASLEINLHLLQIMKAERPTPVIIAAIPVIESLLKKQEASPSDIAFLLENCRKHDNAWNGLGIIECADESLEEACDEIRAIWTKI